MMSKTYLDKFMEERKDDCLREFTCEDIKYFLKKKGVLLPEKCTSQDLYGRYWCEGCIDKVRDVLKQEYKEPEPLLSKDDYDLLCDLASIRECFECVKIWETQPFKYRNSTIRMTIISLYSNNHLEYLEFKTEGIRFNKLERDLEHRLDVLLERGYKR